MTKTSPETRKRQKEREKIISIAAGRNKHNVTRNRAFDQFPCQRKVMDSIGPKTGKRFSEKINHCVKSTALLQTISGLKSFEGQK